MKKYHKIVSFFPTMLAITLTLSMSRPAVAHHLLLKEGVEVWIDNGRRWFDDVNDLIPRRKKKNPYHTNISPNQKCRFGRNAKKAGYDNKVPKGITSLCFKLERQRNY